MRNAADARSLAQLKEFLYEFNQHGYAAAGQNNRASEADGSTSIRWEAEPWKGHDNFFGGDPFGGRLVVHLHGRPFWMMVYHGKVRADRNQDQIFAALRECLKQMSRDWPLRDPREWRTGSYVYRCNNEGEIDAFFLEESVEEGGVLAYRGRFVGGLVDQR